MRGEIGEPRRLLGGRDPPRRHLGVEMSFRVGDDRGLEAADGLPLDDRDLGEGLALLEVGAELVRREAD